MVRWLVGLVVGGILRNSRAVVVAVVMVLVVVGVGCGSVAQRLSYQSALDHLCKGRRASGGMR